MPMDFGSYPGDTAALAIVTGATGALVGALRVAGCVRNAKGIYTVTLAQGCDPTQCVPVPSSRIGSAGRIFDVLPTSDTTIQVTVANTGGDLTDTDFQLAVFRTASAS
jgi:hypothetical protein